MTCIFVVTVVGQRDDDENRNDSPNQAEFLMMAAGHRLAGKACGGTAWAQQVLCPFPSPSPKGRELHKTDC